MTRPNNSKNAKQKTFSAIGGGIKDFASEEIVSEWSKLALDKPMKVLEFAKLIGITATDEQIYAFSDYIKMYERSMQHLMHYERLTIILTGRDRLLNEINSNAKKDHELLKKLVKDFYETYEVEGEIK